MPKVLVLGGGSGGLVASNVLKRELGAAADVTLIDRNRRHYYQSSYPMLLIGGRKPGAITRRLERLQRKGIEFHQAKITGVDPYHRKVVTTTGSLSFDYLVISLGAELHPETVPGFRRNAYNIYDFWDLIRLRHRLANFSHGRVVLFISSLPFKCPPAPSEFMFLLDQLFRQRGCRNRVSLTMVTPETSPEPLAGPLVGQSVRRMLGQRGIKLITEAKVLRLDPGNLVLDQGIEVRGDIFLGIPPHWGPDALRGSGLVEAGGWVKVDPHTLETGVPGVYAIGDATAVRLPVAGIQAPKAGAFAHNQAEVVARNLANIVRGAPPRFRYTGRGV